MTGKSTKPASTPPPLPGSGGGTLTPEETDELARFREQWRQEVQQKRQQEATASPLQPQYGSSLKTSAKPKSEPLGIPAATELSKGKARAVPPRSATGGVVDDPNLVEALERMHVSSPSPSTSPPNRLRAISPTRTRTTAAPRQHIAGGHHQASSSSSHNSKQHHQQTHDTATAVDLYGRAARHEQQGQLNDALRLYRRAYKLDSAVDKAFNRSAAAREVEQAASDQRAFEELEVVDPAKVIDSKPAPVEPYTFHNYSQLHADYAPQVAQNQGLHGGDRRRRRKGMTSTSAVEVTTASPAPHLVRTDPLSRIIQAFKPPGWDPEHPDPDSTGDSTREHAFEAEEDKFPLYIALLPDEVLEHVVDFMDVQTVERFALVNKKTRILTAGAGKWRRLCEQLYRPPVVPPKWQLSSAYELHGPRSWRSTFLEEPRLRYDGVYISVCHYVRPGQSDLAWVNVTHLITYHRFLRFYPDGTVISLLTTDHPVDVVHTIKPSLRAKGLLFGQWCLTEPPSDDQLAATAATAAQDDKAAGQSEDHSAASERPSKKQARAIRHVELRSLLEPGVTPKYEFEMDLSLRTTTRGRWNKLEMLTYQSINLANGEALGLSLKHQRPFYFSKVRSYQPSL